MTRLKDIVYKPDPNAHELYSRIFDLYLQVHDAFGAKSDASSLGNVMKDLLKIKAEARGVTSG